VKRDPLGKSLGFLNCVGVLLSPLLSGSSGVRALFQNSFNSSSCMYLVALWRNSSNVVAGCMHKLSENGPDFSAVTIWCIATLRLRFHMFKVVLPNLSMKALKDSTFS